MAFRALWIVTGVLVVLAGLAMTILPGPATVVIPTRLVRLATASATMRAWLRRGLRRLRTTVAHRELCPARSFWRSSGYRGMSLKCESRRFSTHAGSLTLSVTVGRGPGCTDIRMKCFDCKRSLTKATTIWRARRYVGDAWTIVAFCERCRTADFPRRVISGYDDDKPVWKAASYERVPCLTCGAGVVNAVPRYRARTFCSNECATTYRPPRQARGKPMPCSRQPLGTNKVLTRLRRRADG
jgi:hypothetical protein